MRGHEARKVRAVASRLVQLTIANRPLRLAVGLCVLSGSETQDHPAGRETCDSSAADAKAPRRERHQAEHAEREAEKEAVVDARQQLQQHEETAEQAVAEPAAIERPVPGPQRQRHPLCPLQLEVVQVIVSERPEGKDHPRQNGGPGVPRQASRQQIRAARRCDDTEQREQVHHRERRHAGPDEGQGQHPLKEHRIRVGQRAFGRPEDVGVEQLAGRAHQLT